MYEQTLINIIDDHIKPHVLKRMNKGKKWKYGYNEAHDIVVISKSGQIGEIYEIQNLKIALPIEFDVVKFKDNKWCYTDYPKELSRFKSVFDWNEAPDEFKNKWFDYIDT